MRDTWWNLSLCLILLAIFCCNPNQKNQNSSEPSIVEPKDLVTFQLPETIRKFAPLAQNHFLQLLPYNTPRHQVKPRFIFIDRAETIVAPMSALVDRLNFLHVVYFREGLVAWSGSLLYGQKESPLATTKEGFHVGVISSESGYEVSFQDGDRHFKKMLPTREDATSWLEDQGSRLLIYHYVFTEKLLVAKP